MHPPPLPPYFALPAVRAGMCYLQQEAAAIDLAGVGAALQMSRALWCSEQRWSVGVGWSPPEGGVSLGYPQS